MVVFQWTPKRILFSADSLYALIVQPVKYSTSCKIHQKQDIFFGMTGISDYTLEPKVKGLPTIKFDFIPLARQASRQPGNLRAKISLFDKLALPEVHKLWRFQLEHEPGTIASTGNRISLFLVSRTEHAIAVKSYGGKPDGNIVHRTQFDGFAPGQSTSTEYQALGISDEGQDAVNKNPRLSRRLEGVRFIVGIIEAQIAHEKNRLRDNRIQRVGGPISVLEIIDQKAAWIPGYQHPCPDIKR